MAAPFQNDDIETNVGSYLCPPSCEGLRDPLISQLIDVMTLKCNTLKGKYISDLFERLREKAFPMLGKRGQTMSRLLIKALSHTGLLAAPPVAWDLPQN